MKENIIIEIYLWVFLVLVTFSCNKMKKTRRQTWKIYLCIHTNYKDKRLIHNVKIIKYKFLLKVNAE